MDLNYLKKLLKLLDESNSTELLIEEEGIKIKLSKSGKSTQVVQQVPAQAQVFVPQPQAAASTHEEQPAPVAITKTDKHTIQSPIVGTFYSAPSPDSPPFVEIGTHISEGQTLCIVEAMKLMNEIESDVSGIVEEILVKNGNPVEFNQPLFVIKPD